MKHVVLKRFMSLLSLGVLIAAVLLATGCGDKQTEAAKTESSTESSSQEEAFAHTFTFKMKDGETEKEFEIKTNETTVGAALLAEGLVEGTVEQYGLYIKTVCGIKHEYTEDGKYWAFYEGDQYAMQGVDLTDIVDGTIYCLKAE